MTVILFVTVFGFVKSDFWDMLNNFCLHVYAQLFMFMGENGNGVSGTIIEMVLKSKSDRLWCQLHILAYGEHAKDLIDQIHVFEDGQSLDMIFRGFTLIEGQEKIVQVVGGQERLQGVKL